MAAYTFRIVMPLEQEVSRVLRLETDNEALEFGRRLLLDWPDCEAVEIAADGGMLDKLRPSPLS